MSPKYVLPVLAILVGAQILVHRHGRAIARDLELRHRALVSSLGSGHPGISPLLESPI
jgi:hypothetical protein